MQLLTKSAGIELSPKTKGAVVSQTRETSIDGIFACGNALQVHDLVDFVSEESEIAGKNSAKYALNGKVDHDYLTCFNGNNINYVLPQKLDKKVKGDVKLYFRVTNTFKNCLIVVKNGMDTIIEKKRPVAVPGEMETLILPYDKFKDIDGEITVSLEVL